MKKLIGVFATVALSMALLPAAFAQQDQSPQDPAAQPSTTQPGTAQPSDQQQPEATPQASPSQQQPDMTPQSSPSQDTTSPSTQPSTSQDSTTASPASQNNAYTGTIVKAGGEYVLKTDTMTYQLDDQEKAKVYANKQVSVTGSVDQSTSTLHVTDIMPAQQQ